MSEESTPACPRLEDIAALLDRRLSGPARQALLDHLANCDRCYSVFASTSESLADRRVEGSRLPRRRWRLIAGLAIAGAAGLALWCSAPPRNSRPTSWTRAAASAGAPSTTAVPSALSLAASLLGATTDEPAGDEPSTAELAPGALEMRLALALAEGRRAEASELAHELGRRLRGAEAELFLAISAELRADRPAVADWPSDLVDRRFNARRGVEARCAQATLSALRRGVPSWLSSTPGLACGALLTLPEALADGSEVDEARLRLLEPALSSRIREPGS